MKQDDKDTPRKVGSSFTETIKEDCTDSEETDHCCVMQRFSYTQSVKDASFPHSMVFVAVPGPGEEYPIPLPTPSPGKLGGVTFPCTVDDVGITLDACLTVDTNDSEPDADGVHGLYWRWSVYVQRLDYDTLAWLPVDTKKDLYLKHRQRFRHRKDSGSHTFLYSDHKTSQRSSGLCIGDRLVFESETKGCICKFDVHLAFRITI
jgi:hypothetical protein